MVRSDAGGTSSMERVALLVDGDNLDFSGSLNFASMAGALVGDRQCTRRCIYLGLYPSDACDEPQALGRSHAIRLADALSHASEKWTVHFLPIVFRRQRGWKQQGGDVAIALDALRLAIQGVYDTLILGAGDSDFVPLVEALHGLGRRVEVVAWQDSLAPELLRSADQVTLIDDRPAWWNAAPRPEPRETPCPAPGPSAQPRPTPAGTTRPEPRFPAGLSEDEQQRLLRCIRRLQDTSSHLAFNFLVDHLVEEAVLPDLTRAEVAGLVHRLANQGVLLRRAMRHWDAATGESWEFLSFALNDDHPAVGAARDAVEPRRAPLSHIPFAAALRPLALSGS